MARGCLLLFYKNYTVTFLFNGRYIGAQSFISQLCLVIAMLVETEGEKELLQLSRYPIFGPFLRTPIFWT